MTMNYASQKVYTAWRSDHSEKGQGMSIKYEDGYTSWCPLEAFGKGTVAIGHVSDLPDFVQRLAAEFSVLDSNLTKLAEFLLTAEQPDPAQGDQPGKIGVSAVQLEMMRAQLDAMRKLHAILRARLLDLIGPSAHTRLVALGVGEGDDGA